MTTKMPIRNNTGGIGSDDDAIPDTDPSDTSSLLLERLQAYKHACGYLENYFTETEKVHKAHAKEYGKQWQTSSILIGRYPIITTLTIPREMPQDRVQSSERRSPFRSEFGGHSRSFREHTVEHSSRYFTYLSVVRRLTIF